MTSFLVIWIGQIFSALGSGLTSFAMGVWVYDQTGSVSLLAWNMLAWLVPYLVVSPVAGVLADRLNRRFLMMASDFGAGCSSLLLLVLLLGGNLQVWHVFVTTALTAACSAVQWPAYSSAIPQIVPKELLGRANALVQVQSFLFNLVAPALAGVLYVSENVGLPGIFVIDLVTFLIAISTQFVIRIPNPTDSEGPINFWKDFREGWGFIANTTGLLHLAVFYMAINFLQEFTYPLMQPLFLEITTPAGFGISQSIMGAGAIVGMAVMAVWGGPKKQILPLMALYIFNGFIILLAGLRPSVVLITICGFLYFSTTPMQSSLFATFMQTTCPIKTQGRVFAAFDMLTSAVRPFALILAGPLADGFFEPALATGGQLASTVGSVIGVGPGRGIAFFISIIGAMMAVVSLVAFFNRSIRRLDDVRPDMV